MLICGVASAEQGQGIAGSGMVQGSGAISTRSDVEVAVEYLKGTSRARLGTVGQVVAGQLGDIRACYAKATKARPTTEGSLRVEVRIPEKSKRAQVKIAHDQVEDPPLNRCVVKALKAGTYSHIPGPAGGLVVIDFTNSAAEGAALVAREAASKVASVTTNAEGQPTSVGRTPDGRVEVVVTGRGKTPREAVAALSSLVQSRIGKILDCRRRASRRDMDPEGEISLRFTVSPRGVGSGRSRQSTVQDTVAPSCVIRALKIAVRRQRQAAGQFDLLVKFAPR